MAHNRLQKIYRNTVLDSRSRQDGSVKVIYRVQIDGIKKDYSTGIFWNKDFFDAKNQVLLPRFKNDPEVAAANHRLQIFQSRAAGILLKFFNEDKVITIQHFTSNFEFHESQEDFFWFADQRTNHFHDRGIITTHTRNTFRTTFNRLKEFRNNEALPIGEFTLELIEEFHAWARKKKYAHNTICGFHKNYKKFLNIAIKEQKLATNPYVGFKFSYQDGMRAVLTQDEVSILDRLLIGNELSDTEKEVLRRFLFSCTTGIRISDTHRVRSWMIKDGALRFKPYKTEYKGKNLTIPLSDYSKDLIEGRDGLLFEPLSDKHINFCLKVISGIAKIDKRLTYHVARDTFGTIFIELGGDVASLKDIMGHSSVKTTMIYLKMSDKRKQLLMNNFDTFLKRPKS